MHCATTAAPRGAATTLTYGRRATLDLRQETAEARCTFGFALTRSHRLRWRLSFLDRHEGCSARRWTSRVTREEWPQPCYESCRCVCRNAMGMRRGMRGLAVLRAIVTKGLPTTRKAARTRGARARFFWLYESSGTPVSNSRD